MCTAISIIDEGHLFGRTLDLETSLGEEIVITPKGHAFNTFKTKYGIIGAAVVKNGTPLYFDGMNERGLCAAALNYPSCAFYGKPREGLLNLPSFELIPYILGNCADTEEALRVLSHTNVTDTPFSEELAPSPLHWLIADKKRAICAEPDKHGLTLHDNPFRIMTNSPGFSYHSNRVCDYMGLRAEPPQNHICKRAELSPYSRGLGAVGLPGDFSSSSRFVRALFALENTERSKNGISDFFHIMDTVSVPSGSVIAENGRPVRSVYTCCADTDSLTYYFTTYECRRIYAVRLTDCLAECPADCPADCHTDCHTDYPAEFPATLTRFPMPHTEDIATIN